MNADGVWRGFFDTGDPFCYLLAKRLEEQDRRKEEGESKKEQAGEREATRSPN